MILKRRGGGMLKYCSIGSGSSGNCHYIGYKDTNILVDAGLSGKRITTGLKDIEVDIDIHKFNVNDLLNSNCDLTPSEIKRRP